MTRRALRRLATLVCVLAGVGGFATTATAAAATYTVGTQSDTTPGATCANFPSGCSLRQLIEYEDGLPSPPNPADVIVVPGGVYGLTNGSLVIDQSMAITGAGVGAAGAAIYQNTTSASSRVFDIQQNVNLGLTPEVVISGLAIHGGTADNSNGSFGGDIRNQAELTLSEDLITDGNAQSGGGISNDQGTLIVTHSLVYNNTASSGGADSGGIQNYGHSTAGRVVVEDSTIADNTSNLGGGIYSWCDGTEGACSSDGTTNTTAIVNSTIANNDGGTRSAAGGGLLATQGTIFVQNSIVAGNTVSGGAMASNCGASSSGVITSLGHNLDSGTDCGFAAAGDLRGVDPQFLTGTVADNGGSTFTLALSASSPALDAIPSSASGCGGSDQRDVSRPQGAGCDIGAYELFQPQAGRQFTEVLGAIDPASRSASIDWGDGTTSAPDNVDSTTGQVTGTHTYLKEGVYHASVDWVNSDHIAERTPFDVKVVASPQPPVTTATTATPVPTAIAATTPPAALTGAPSVGPAGARFTGSVNPGGLPTSAHFEYGLDSRYSNPGTPRPVYDHSTTAQPVGSDFSSHAVSTSVSGLVPNALYHVRLVATNSAGTTFGPDQTFKTRMLAPPPAPALGRTFNIKPVHGIVLIKVHGVFVPLTELRQIPSNTPINALHGTLRLVTAASGAASHLASDATAKPKRHNGKAKHHKTATKTQSGMFGGAIFKINQIRGGRNRGLVTLSLVENAFKGAPSYATCTRHPSRDATTARVLGLRRGHSHRVLQLLHSTAHGRYRTRGRYSAATVRGTKWTIADRCDGTLTHDITHSVVVRDLVHHKTIILHAGQRYLARPIHPPR